MVITGTKIPGAYIITRLPNKDGRGAFTRMFCKRELEQAGICADIAQINHCFSADKKTLRGMHAQGGEAAEDKLVSCISGRIFDVCLDMRENSSAYLQWIGMELAADKDTALYIPKGCAHGYLTLTDNVQMLYFSTNFYAPESETGYRFDDSAFDIDWPLPEPYIMSDKDRNWKYITI